MLRLTCTALALALAACASPEPTALPPPPIATPPVIATPVPPPAPDLSPAAVAARDEFLWLEEVNGQRAMTWVNEQNAKTRAVLEADPRYKSYEADARAILTAQDRIATPRFRAGGIDNFWQDQTHVRGLWRRTTLDSYRTASPKWETVLDIDALAKTENANWIYKGADCLDPDERLCLVSLSDGGKDAVVIREFDATAKKFVDNGFRIPEGKHRLTWLDKDTLLVATDFGAGSLTESGYPYIVKSLKRGQSLAQATELYRGAAGDGGYGVDPYVLRNGKGEVLSVLVSRPLDTFRSETWEIVNGKPVKLDLPERVTIRGAMGTKDHPRLVFTIEESWKFNMRDQKPGALMDAYLPSIRAGAGESITNGDVTIFEPGPRQSVDSVAVFDDKVVATIYDNVRGRALAFTDHGEFGGWRSAQFPTPENVAIHLGSTSRATGRFFYDYEGFLTPATLALGSVNETVTQKDPQAGAIRLVDVSKAQVIRQAPAKFDASKHVVEQFEATSKDGTKIPYFLVRPAGALTGSTPTMLFGYGGFQVSFPPVYKPELGKLWLEKGNAYVVANIRGGGEFGPEWHQSVLKEKRQGAFDDFAAVAADLAKRGVTSAKNIGIYGRSNGGVLTSVTLTQHPELIGGAVIESPLVDMLRYHELPPGASWMGEYGDPRIPAEAAFIAKYSAYQNIKPGQKYPLVYITTNTRDDRVHPGHARKFAARLQAAGYPVLYFENTDGGHSNDSDPILNSARWARHYLYLARQLSN